MCLERDRALLLFLADTGCRVGGLVGLTLSDLKVRRRWALVTEKFDKSRLVFFPEVTAEALRDWLRVRLEWDIGGDWVFLSHHGGGQLTVYGVNQLMGQLKEGGVTSVSARSADRSAEPLTPFAKASAASCQTVHQ
jgi:integrase